MRLRSSSCRSLRELLFTLFLVASASVLLTYHLSKYLPQRHHTEVKIQFNGRVDIYRNIKPVDPGGDLRRALEGIELEPRPHRTGNRGNRGRERQRTPPAHLLQQIQQLEDGQLSSAASAPPDETKDASDGKVAVVRGQSAVMDRDLPVYQQALHRAGFTLKVPAWYQPATHRPSLEELEFDTKEDSEWGDLEQRPLEWEGWSLLLCLAVQDGNTGVCLHPETVSSLNSHQKVSHIPGIRSTLWRKDRLCATMTQIKNIPAIRHSQLSPLCYVLPAQHEQFLNAADASGGATKWVYKTLGPGHRVQLLQPTLNRDYLKIKMLGNQPAVVQRYVDSPLLLFGMPLSVRVFVLVTSLTPLRAYVHSQGVVQYRHDYQHNFDKVSGRTWTLDQLQRYLADTYSRDAARTAFTNMDSVIVQTLLVAEVMVSRQQQTAGLARCPNCFQLLEFELIFNSSFHPIVTEVNGQPDLQDITHVEDWERGAVRNSVVEDMVAMVTATSHIAPDVARALAELNQQVSVEKECSPSQDSDDRLCLSYSDIQYLLAMRRESLHRRGFKQLYPCADSEKYSSLISQLERHPGLSGDVSSQLPRGIHQPAVRAAKHSVYISVAKYFNNMEFLDDSYDDLNTPLLFERSSKEETSAKLVDNIFYNSTDRQKRYQRATCSEEQSTKPLLAGIYTEPQLNFTPQFNPSVMEYYATVSYDVILVKVWAFAQSCNSEARLDAKYGLSRPSNYTLGLGSNKITIHVVDITHTEPWILNTYSVYLNRLYPGEGLQVFRPSQPHQVCSLIQDCELRYLPSLPCGLQPTLYHSWRQYQQHASQFPHCTSADAPGRWLVPCKNCSHSSSCHWEHGVWQPEKCSHPTIPRETLKQCLAGKQILFIGDSTNRGIMHYLMEQVNDSLTEWDKTHDTRLYSNLNRDQTTVSFAYYPQFWLPSSQRPVFDKTLYDLLKQTEPLENNHNTVLIVGGVHWLSTHHLGVIKQALRREDLTGIRVIMKSLGAGFHQPTDGLHCLTLREQRKLVIHNAGLSEFARQHDFEVIDTFNMTMARYKDFLQGKCACHFHRVKEVLPSFTEYLKTTRQNSQKLTDMPIHYHVEGVVNKAYSELLLNRICDYV